MKKLEAFEIENLKGGGRIGCGLAVAGYGLATASLFLTGAGASLAVALIASQSYVVATLGLATCFGDF